MYSLRMLFSLVAACVAWATLTNAHIHIHMPAKRQVSLSSGVSPTSSVPPVSSEEPASSTSIPVFTPPTLSSSSTSSSSSIITPTASTSSSSISSNTPTPTPTPSSRSSTFESTSSTTIVTSVPRTTVLVTITSDGQVLTAASTDFSLTTTTSAQGSTNTDGSNSGSSSSMDPKTRSTIIGVTVGIGGAIILAGLAFVAWRLWGKRRATADEDEILVNGSNAHSEKLSSPGHSSGSPFRSNLEQYHANPGTNF